MKHDTDGLLEEFRLGSFFKIGLSPDGNDHVDKVNYSDELQYDRDYAVGRLSKIMAYWALDEPGSARKP